MYYKIKYKQFMNLFVRSDILKIPSVNKHRPLIRISLSSGGKESQFERKGFEINV